MNLTKLTMVSIRYNSRLYTFFAPATTVEGRSVIAKDILERLLNRIGVRRGDTYTLG